MSVTRRITRSMKKNNELKTKLNNSNISNICNVENILYLIKPIYKIILSYLNVCKFCLTIHNATKESNEIRKFYHCPKLEIHRNPKEYLYNFKYLHHNDHVNLTLVKYNLKTNERIIGTRLRLKSFTIAHNKIFFCVGAGKKASSVYNWLPKKTFFIFDYPQSKLKITQDKSHLEFKNEHIFPGLNLSCKQKSNEFGLRCIFESYGIENRSIYNIMENISKPPSNSLFTKSSKEIFDLLNSNLSSDLNSSVYKYYNYRDYTYLLQL